MLEAAELMLPNTAQVRLAAACSIVSIAAFKDMRLQLDGALGVALPVTPVCVVAAGTRYLWAGDEAWLAISDDLASLERIENAGAEFAAVTDQSAGRAVFFVNRADVRVGLAKLVPVDLYAGVFAQDATALTLAGHIPVQIWREGGEFALCCFRSYANALYHALVEAI